MKSVEFNSEKPILIDQSPKPTTSKCNETAAIAAGVIRSFHRLSEISANHTYTTSFTPDKFANLRQLLQKNFPNFNIGPSCEHHKVFFDELLDHITTMRTSPVEILKTLHSIEEILNGSAHLRRIESALFQSNIMKPPASAE